MNTHCPPEATQKSGYTPWKEEWKATVKDYPSGQREAMIRRIWRHKGAPLPILRKSRGEGAPSIQSKENAAQRARAAVRDKIKSLGGDYMLTMTTRKNITELDQFTKLWKEFNRRLKPYQELLYVAVQERQARGAWHAHVAVKGRQNIKLIRSVWQSILGGEGAGSVHIRSPFKERNLRHRISMYLTKYMTKNSDEHQFNRKRYWASRKIPKPMIEWWMMSGEFSLIEVVQTGFELVHGRDCVFWWNQALGVFWLSAGPLD